MFSLLLFVQQMVFESNKMNKTYSFDIKKIEDDAIMVIFPKELFVALFLLQVYIQVSSHILYTLRI